ncbi:MAG: hypothetical protein ACYS76_13375 [Planctomycetota bacterium]|jgi:hypothetical protein
MTYPLRREIKKSDATAVFRVHFPEDWPLPTKVNINIRDLDGNLLVTTGTATVLATTTLSSAITKGTKTAVFGDDILYESDDLLRVGSEAQGFQQMTVETYTSSTQTAVFTDRFNVAYAANSAVQARFAIYSADASGWDDDISQVTAEWVPDAEAIPIVEMWEVLERVHDIGGLEETFSARYPTEWNEIDPGKFAIFQRSAHNIIRTEWEAKSLNLDKLVGNDYEYQELLLRQIAFLVNPTETNENAYNDYFTTVCSLEKWIDDDQDLIQEPDEVRSGTAFTFQRRF